jgi:hypothetical protein
MTVGKADSTAIDGDGPMNWKRTLGIACLVLAALGVVVGVRSMGRGEGPALGDASGLGVSHAVGTFMPALIALILGLWLLGKSKQG